MADSAVKKHYDYAQQQIDEQAILDKYNAATIAQFNVQREQNRQAENQFYNEMYNTQKTAMDTIRQANASAVATGASRGVQAAQELSSLLGLQQESVASATELAQANRQTAQEETAAVLENVLNAYKQATDERAQLMQSAVEAESVETDRKRYLLDLKVNDPAAYYSEIAKDNNAADFVNMSEQQLNINTSNANQAFDAVEYNIEDINKGTGSYSSLLNIYASHGLTKAELDADIAAINTELSKKPGDVSVVAGAGIGAMPTAIAGAVIGGPLGFLVGAAIGAITGGITASNTQEASKADKNKAAKEMLQVYFAARYAQKYNSAKQI